MLVLEMKIHCTVCLCRKKKVQDYGKQLFSVLHKPQQSEAYLQ